MFFVPQIGDCSCAQFRKDSLPKELDIAIGERRAAPLQTMLMMRCDATETRRPRTDEGEQRTPPREATLKRSPGEDPQS